MAEKSTKPAVRRSVARLLAIQALYEIELSGAPVSQVVRDFLDQRLEESLDGSEMIKPDRQLFAALVEGVARENQDLDDMVAGALAEDWPLDRLETILRLVMRAGTYELASSRDVPARVVITEYMDIAHAFFDGKEPAMVNGVLDHLARTLRMEEFEPNVPAG